MADLIASFQSHTFWWWAAGAAGFLAVEVATGTSYLLWPAAAAAVIGVLQLLGVPLGDGFDVGLFAVLTIAMTLAARHWIKKPEASGPDINDPRHRLTGRQGEAVGAFEKGQGRVFVDGKEWAAEAEGEAVLAKGDRIEVTAVLDGGQLKVRPA